MTTQQKTKPTPEANSERINGISSAIHEMQASFESSIRELQEVTRRDNKLNRWFLGIALALMTSAAGFWGDEVLSRLRSVEDKQGAQATSLAVIQKQLDYQAKFEVQLDELESRLREIEQGRRKD